MQGGEHKLIRHPLVGDQLLALGSEYSVKLVGLGQVGVWLLFDHHLHVGGDVDYGEGLVKMSAPHKYLDILTWGKKNIKISSKGRLMFTSFSLPILVLMVGVLLIFV